MFLISGRVISFVKPNMKEN